ncbi:hypothetical protein M2146_003206 [Lachnospiraceae bacterium PF1-22]|uniref:hypothetical protein n=1 Tax=Ohessyouella blattaphilus TaxID=2949333 RepID=UPI003E1DD424
MRNKKSVQALLFWLIKVIIAAILAFFVVNIFCIFYYNIPLRQSLENDLTDYKWKANAYQSRLTEGYGHGHIDSYGYNNDQSLTEEKQPDVLIVGSSHMEGFQVSQKKNMAYSLNTLLEVDNLSTYSIGISGHTLLTNFSNIDNILKSKLPQYIVFETENVSFDPDSITQVINNDFPHIGGSERFEALSQIPYLRLLYLQLQNLEASHVTPSSIDTEHSKKTGSDISPLLESLSYKCQSAKATPIIFYHPHLSIDDEGNVQPLTQQDALKAFSTACQNADIVFIDMTDSFISEYEHNRTLPHGFMNTEIGTGHLNATGHRLCAEEVFKSIHEIERIKK